MNTFYYFLTNLDKSRLYSKNVLVVLIVSCIFLISHPWVEVLVKEFLSVEPFKSVKTTSFFDFIFLLLSVIIALYAIHKLFIKYRASFYANISLWLCLSYYFSFRWSATWQYVPTRYLSLAYLDLIIIALCIYPVIHLIFGLLLYRNFPVTIDRSNRNILIEDTPEYSLQNDILERNTIVRRLKNTIINDNFLKSFTIGLIGPWGNGKSSVLYGFQKEIQKEKLNDILQVSFSPYLNHSKDEIITSFFNEIRFKLRKFDGSLNKSLSKYAATLFKTYKGGIVSDIIDFTSNKSIYTLYKNINNTIKKIDKKVVVVVDDLDRLDVEEILEVFKLIRNTANFYNFIFIVAIDKDYIVNAIKEKESSKHHKFVEKFFQLEIYLPKIKPNTLFSEFDFHIRRSPVLSHEDKEKLVSSVLDERNLFYHYVSNLRDIKKIVNQIVFDIQFLKEEIDPVDFMNFTFLKSRYPSSVEFLLDNKGRYFNLIDGKYILIEDGKQQDERIFSTEEDKTENKRYFKGFTPSKLETDLKLKFQIDKCNYEYLDLDCKNYELFNLTVHSLFAIRDNTPNNSIQFQNTFHLLMHMTYPENDFSNSEFMNLLNGNSEMETRLRIASEKNQIAQLWAKTKNYSPINELEFDNYIALLFELLNDSQKNNLNTELVFLKIFNLFDEKLRSSYSEIEPKEYYKEHCFENSSLKLKHRIRVVSTVYNATNISYKWGFSNNEYYFYAKNYLLELFKNLDFIDYTFFQNYHFLKTIFNPKTKEFDLKKQFSYEIKKVLSANTELLEQFTCLTLDADGGIGELFKLSSVVKEIFEDFGQYKLFLDNIENRILSEELREYLQFLELSSLLNYNRSVKFVFSSFKTRNSSREIDPSYIHFKNQSDRVLQLFFKINTKMIDIFNFTSTTSFIEIKDGASHNVLKGGEYLEMTIFSNDKIQFVIAILNFFRDTFISELKGEVYISENKIFNTFNGERNIIFELISSQPQTIKIETIL